MVNPMTRPPRRRFTATEYRGTRTPYTVSVTRNSNSRCEALHWRLDLWPHSPTGLEWGYGGSGPAQLALALLADATGDDSTAVSLYQWFKRDVVAALPHDNWTLTAAAIMEWVDQHAEHLADRKETDERFDKVVAAEYDTDAPDSPGQAAPPEALVDVVDGKGVVQHRQVPESYGHWLAKDRPDFLVVKRMSP